MANLPLSNIFYRKTRTGIGILSVALGVAMVLVIVGLADGSLNEYADRITNVGADIMFMGPDSSPFLVLNTGVMSERLAQKLAEVDGVKAVAPVLHWRVTSIKGTKKLVAIFGVDLSSYNRIGGGVQIVNGTGFQKPSDIIVDTVLSSADGLDLGDTLPMMSRDFDISGICKAGAGARIYMDLDALQEASGQPDKVSLFLIKVADGNRVSDVAAALEKKFEGYKVTALEGFVEELKDNALGLKHFVRVLSLLAVLISFLVILLAMYTTIIERTREIGVLKALGAGKLYIIRLVITESFLICVLGVMVGYGLSLLGRFVILTFFPTLTVSLIASRFVVAALLGICGGLLGALYPAYRAAKLDPVEALNFE
jgi:putative ABC transport system permease protein